MTDRAQDVFAFVVVSAVVLLCFLLALRSETQWERFKVDHRCRVVGEVQGGSHLGLSSNGDLVTTFEPDKTSWLCDNGMTYTR